MKPDRVAHLRLPCEGRKIEALLYGTQAIHKCRLNPKLVEEQAEFLSPDRWRVWGKMLFDGSNDLIPWQVILDCSPVRMEPISIEIDGKPVKSE